MRYHQAQRRRRGYVLIWFALFVWVILGVAALVIDLGLARMARNQMVTAADASALEGLRLRDEVPPDLYAAPDVQAALIAAAGPISPSDPAWLDRARRWYASRLVSWQFDSSADTSSSAPQYGAGPLLSLTGGFALANSNFNASQTLALGSPLFYVPQPQLNTGNAVFGDLVSGTFTSSGVAIENTDYTRPDFTPDSSPPTAATPGNAFLVRLRRTNDRQGLDNVSGVSSSAPPIPYLFGRGTLLAPTLKGDGITVRGTAIANAQPVLSAGPGFVSPDGSVRLPGVTPFGLTVAFWNALKTSDQENATIGPSGSITINPGSSQAGVIAGNFTAPPTQVTAVGQPFVSAAASVPANQDLYRYVPLYATVGSSRTRIVGFGHISASWTATTISFSKRTPPTTSGTATMTALATRNASPTLRALDSTLAPADVAALFAYVQGGITDPLRAAVLVNR